MNFNLTEPEEAQAFANLCRCLNAAGVPYEFSNSGELVTLTVGNGY